MQNRQQRQEWNKSKKGQKMQDGEDKNANKQKRQKKEQISITGKQDKKGANLCSSKFWTPFAAWTLQFHLAKILHAIVQMEKRIDKLHKRTHIPKS